MYKYPYGDSQQLNLDWILAKLKELEEAGLGLDLEDVSKALISLPYNTSTSYRRYDYAFLNSKLYRCLTDTSGVFDPSAWQEALIGDDLAVLTRWINAIDAAAVVDVKFDTFGTNGKLQQKYHDQYHDVVEVDYTPVQNSKRPLSSNAGYELNRSIETVIEENNTQITIPSGNTTQTDIVSGFSLKKGTYIAEIKQENSMTTNQRNTFWYFDSGRVYESTGTNRHLNAGTYRWYFTIDHDLNSTSIGIWLNGNDVNVSFSNFKLYALPQEAYDNLNGAITNVQKQITANVQTSTTASNAYAVGEFLVLNGVLYRVTSAISNGGTITPNTNVVATTIADEENIVFPLTLDNSYVYPVVTNIANNTRIRFFLPIGKQIKGWAKNTSKNLTLTFNNVGNNTLRIVRAADSAVYTVNQSDISNVFAFYNELGIGIQIDVSSNIFTNTGVAFANFPDNWTISF